MMTTGQMGYYTNRYKEILASGVSQFIKDAQLAGLMTALEHTYRISMFPELNKRLEREQPWVMQLYRTVSDARVM